MARSFILSLDCHFCIVPYEQFISSWNLSAAGQAQKGAKWPDLYILSLECNFYIAPYEQRRRYQRPSQASS